MSSTVKPAQRRMVRIATRRSALAMAQTKLIVERLQESVHLDCEILPITTKGDAQRDRSLVAIGGDGVFVRELMNALLDERADIAVHSAKDLPTALPPELDAGAIPERADARDVLVSANNIYKEVSALPVGAVVGTSSLRRAAQLRLLRNDLRIEPLRGNVDTRVGKVRNGEYDAAVLALAGLQRIGLLESVGGGSPLDADIMVPAVGQGALFVQCRAADEFVLGLLAPLNHAASALAVRLERAFLARIGGGCVAPIGAHAWVTSGAWQLHALIAATDGTTFLRRSAQGSALDAAEAVAAVEAVASEMLAAGGREIVASARQRDVDMR
ncbi:MAG: hydroxymethylbilane synthase [Candidatus Eremiobacteraeota bacterium]|nr:hydroxymethylbilane synthase [Candidatus Eremiobacteraeota bacterium]